MSAARVGEHSEVEWKFVKRSPCAAMRSMVGVGMTPPKVLGAPKPWSSVMMSSTLGAPFGGTTRGGHHAFDSDAFSLITPPNAGSGGGSCLPVIVVVASGEPGTPVTCWAGAEPQPRARRHVPVNRLRLIFMAKTLPLRAVLYGKGARRFLRLLALSPPPLMQIKSLRTLW